VSVEQRSVTVAGYGWEIPGVETTLLWRVRPDQIQPDAFDPHARLGKKGIRYKDRATLLGLSAAKAALASAGLPMSAEDQIDKPRFGVVVSSNLGNLETVERVVRVIHEDHVRATSAMDLPNASSNIVASTAAIRYGMQSVNLTVCSGASSGLDALELAALCIRARRADRMLVIGVEVASATARALLGLPDSAPLFDGAFAVVLEAQDCLWKRGRRARIRLGEFRHAVAGAGSVPRLCALTAADVSQLIGESYGVEGVAQLVLAAQVLPDRAVGEAWLIGGGRLGDDRIAALAVQVSP
jgi:3-oxoacyl-[acyl-carrier-protein] synthase II